MIRAFFFLFTCVFICTRTTAQEVIWASKVLEKSSETVDSRFSPKHRAIQILGPPSILPQTDVSACSWRPMGVSYGEDYIKVGFDKPTKVRQIIVGETVGPGAIGRIFGYTRNNTEVLLYQNTGNYIRKQAGIWNEMIPETQEEIVALKLLIVHSLNKGPKEYDCVGISASNEPFIAQVNVAENLPKNLEKVNLGASINSKYSEVAPLVSPDGKYLYFTRLDHPKNYNGRNDVRSTDPTRPKSSQDVWVSKLNNAGAWEPARNMSSPIHDGSKNAAATIAMDGKSIYALNVKLPGGKYDAGLTKVTLKDNKWVNKRQVNILGFEALDYYNHSDKEWKKETEFSMSSDEKYLVMGLVRSDTYGDKDLYVSFKTGDNTYSKPLNLGAVLNTAGNEGSPFLAADNKTLYFNSNGHPGYGDMDIFVTTRLDDSWTKWSVPINLGPQINSKEFDGYISIPASGEYAYFSSAKNSIGLDDLFQIKLFPGIQPEAVVIYDFQFVDHTSNKEIKPQITFVNTDKPDDKTLKVEFIYDDESKSYKTVLPIGYKYAISATMEGYNAFREEVNLQNTVTYGEVSKIFKLELTAQPQPAPVKEEPAPVQTAKAVVPTAAKDPDSISEMALEAGKKLILKEVYFDQSKADLREESFRELEKIKKIMLENPGMEILLEGHTDNQGDADLNFKLAGDRISNVKNYITQDGTISPKRISIKSWGQYRPLQKNSTEEARTKNRRVEFTIIKM